MDYKSAGVDVEAGYEFVARIRGAVERTRRPEQLGGLGGFGGLFALPAGYREPVLVAGTDGVGTKLKLAFALDRHDTIGIDCVAMCVNDVLAQGAEPLFFLDYLATGKLSPAQLAGVVEGIAAGCLEAGCTLLGGETAEMPGFYAAGEYDVAGFCVGIVERSQIIDGNRVQVGDALLGLSSSGVHSNGFSLVRRIVELAGLDWHHRPEDFPASLGEVLLTPTRIYVKPVRAALEAGFDIRGIAHITGGGLIENVPRALGGLGACLERNSWPVPPVFTWLERTGGVGRQDMDQTFNLGLGLVLACPTEQADALQAYLAKQGEQVLRIGAVVEAAGVRFA
ncbi:phosphoribosylformylglycinamidine cyclo-ligase [Gloeobacter violaceus]|uniref:Phosphoribosylformylglycinamidine cyclo-ligase n=1 Tax=Gloeobacter violaceus (strain ATCC 29082 / PCC 7421) TaxID=251221 RepID=PUR5_GLOVI|nr:phosphoribosylformylglycinamidine cyclo-ligase [Gloeobacter violaceus]Q7NMP5.1 RecName: Full=Phosphoribosylformylglycinamidine cyclo-ligase; AltName: Full=AIR synthase; AltName: Full=AIRS; AltName: Full=Phosphoribosyl-aminoimidazole synthetase [Gloeobacter violaceus PCC 7421]BAC88661.1 phosphoribosyl formylglycinamidine cyclo-ligase [Gloeobacter violaceus PCC 7421]